jgi:hypothetical protein
MLTKAEVIAVVTDELKKAAYTIDAVEHGVDIVATHDQAHPAKRLVVVAQGEPGVASGGRILGKRTKAGSVAFNIARALFKLKLAEASHRPQNPEVRYAFAFPKRTHEHLVRDTMPVLRQNAIGIFWVRPDRQVELESDWTL